MVDMMEMMKKVQKMQADMKKISQELSSEIVTTGAGRGAVIVSISGDMVLRNITIDPKLAPMDDPKALCGLIMSAVNDGMEKAKDVGARKMSVITGGLKLPGLEGLTGK